MAVKYIAVTAKDIGVAAKALAKLQLQRKKLEIAKRQPYSYNCSCIVTLLIEVKATKLPHM